jgi:hypothetical protein
VQADELDNPGHNHAGTLGMHTLLDATCVRQERRCARKVHRVAIFGETSRQCWSACAIRPGCARCLIPADPPALIEAPSKHLLEAGQHHRAIGQGDELDIVEIRKHALGTRALWQS